MTSDTNLIIVQASLLIFTIVGCFGNFNIILASWKNTILHHKCGVLLAVLAICDITCLLNEFQSFIRMTLKLGSTSLKRCFFANIIYIFIEPFEVYMIFALAIDRLIAINFIASYRNTKKSKYVLIMVTPGFFIGTFFVFWSYVTLSDNFIVDICVLPYAMPELVSYWWNQYNLWSAIATMLLYCYTYMTVFCCTFKQKNQRNLLIQKSILNTVVVGAAVFSISSVLSATLIAIFTNMANPPIDPVTISTFAVIPGLVSYSCNYYVYFWRSSDYRTAFVKQLSFVRCFLKFSKSSMILIKCACRCSPTTRTDPRKSLDPRIDTDISRKYMPHIPQWDNNLPNVLEEFDSVQAKQKSEDCTESGIEILMK